MSCRILKFGGSSLGAPDRLTQVIDLIVSEHEQGPIAVVCSAMGETTDWLLDSVDLAAEGDLEGAEKAVDRIADLAISNALVVLEDLASDGPSPTRQTISRPQITPMVRELLEPLRKLLLGISLLRQKTEQTLDTVLSFGERLSATIMAELARARGVAAVFADSREWTVTDDTFGSARVDWEATRERIETVREQWADRVPICTGFLGQTPDGRTTTLGRNGSDYTATLLGRGLGAEEVIICTDVSGVMTAAFSGTLGYLTNEVMKGVPMSQAVRTARELGYTEPRPQDDLSGLDVARKALLLARELGLELDMEDVSVEPLVSQEILDTESLEEFFEALEANDEEFARRVDKIKAANETLRYLAVLDPGEEGEAPPTFKVGPVTIPAEHPATRLRGSEAFVGFTTERYQDYPLIVQGAGAGGAVTAAGVLSDVLRISQNLRGR